MKVSVLLKNDMKIQIRSGYWAVYGILGLIYILVILNLPRDFREIVAVYLILSDTSVLGIIFVGALVLLEKQQGVLKSLSVTPLSFNIYILGKILPLTILSTLVSLAIWISAVGLTPGFGLMLPGVVLSSIVFTTFGVGYAAGANSFNQFIARVVLGTLLLVVPVIPVFLTPLSKWLVFMPVNATLDFFLRLIEGSFSFMQIVDILSLCVWIFIMKWFARVQFKKNMMFL